VRRGLLTQDRLYQLLSRDLNIPYVDVANYIVDPALISIIPTELAQRLQVVPLYRIDDALTVAIADPADIGGWTNCIARQASKINPTLADPEAVRDVVNEYYQSAKTLAIEGAATDAEADEALRYLESEVTDKSAEQLASEAPIVRFVNAMLERACPTRASDIHVEPEADVLRVPGSHRRPAEGIRPVSVPPACHVAPASRSSPAWISRQTPSPGRPL